jgi:hypothetical protein
LLEQGDSKHHVERNTTAHHCRRNDSANHNGRERSLRASGPGPAPDLDQCLVEVDQHHDTGLGGDAGERDVRGGDREKS